MVTRFSQFVFFGFKKLACNQNGSHSHFILKLLRTTEFLIGGSEIRGNSYESKWVTSLAIQANGLLLVDKLSFSLSDRPAFRCRAIMSILFCIVSPFSPSGVLAIVMIARTSIPAITYFAFLWDWPR
jgi:hypothetical protein